MIWKRRSRHGYAPRVPNFGKRTDATVRAGAKCGVLIDYDSTYQAELAKMSAELREAKRTARLEAAALEEDFIGTRVKLTYDMWSAV